MTLVAIGPLGPIAHFLQLLAWIIIPVLLIVLLTTILHHRIRRKRNAKTALTAEDVKLLSAGKADPDGAYLLFDHTGLVHDYRKKLCLSEARYTALKKDFEQLQTRYQHIAIATESNVHPKTNHMETTLELAAPAGPIPSEELYLKDLLEEKKAEVAFLQVQLEQRVRKQHETEGEKERLRTEWEARIAEKEQLIRSKDELLAYAENQLTEIKQQNELLNAAVADGKDKTDSLLAQLEEEQLKANAAEQKLKANKQLLQRLYNEFSACMEAEPREAPVVSFGVA